MASLEFCHWSGKVSHPTPKQAKAILRNVIKRKGSDGTRRVYFCRKCRGWHFGRSREKMKQFHF